jgi:hypothetical protein
VWVGSCRPLSAIKQQTGYAAKSSTRNDAMELEDLFLATAESSLNSPSPLNQRQCSPINTNSLHALATQKAISTTVPKENISSSLVRRVLASQGARKLRRTELAMAIRHVFLFISMLAMACCCAASDPSLLQDFCVADKMSQGTTKVVLLLAPFSQKKLLIYYCRGTKHSVQ